jgi:hypothetical protein
MLNHDFKDQASSSWNERIFYMRLSHDIRPEVPPRTEVRDRVELGQDEGPVNEGLATSAGIKHTLNSLREDIISALQPKTSRWQDMRLHDSKKYKSGSTTRLGTDTDPFHIGAHWH